MKTALELEAEGKIFSILRELEIGKISTYELIRMGYNPELIDLLFRIRSYIIKSERKKHE